jgi:hypothetical protein
MLTCLLRRQYDPAQLLAAHPPRLRHPHKQMVFELACPAGASHEGTIELTRWAATPPASIELAETDVAPVPGHYDYETRDALWHVNFADPQPFVAYGSALLAQDELQAAEHPLLGCLREAMVVENQALTVEGGAATPVLVAGVQRRCEIATAPDGAAGRPLGLYGNRFSAASREVVRRAVRVLDPPTHTNLIAMAAPFGGPGPYWPQELEYVLVTAYTGFAAAVAESRRIWPGAPVEVRTGFWGCGAFGGNRHAMTLLQILAARLAAVDRLRFYVFDDAGRANFLAGAADLERVLAASRRGEPIADVIDRIADLDYEWGVSDGN